MVPIHILKIRAFFFKTCFKAKGTNIIFEISKVILKGGLMVFVHIIMVRVFYLTIFIKFKGIIKKKKKKKEVQGYFLNKSTKFKSVFYNLAYIINVILELGDLCLFGY